MKHSNNDTAKSLACSAGVFWVGKSLLIGSLRWSRHLWFYDRGRLGRVVILTLTVGVRASFNMALSRLKPFARARWKRLHCRLLNHKCLQILGLSNLTLRQNCLPLPSQTQLFDNSKQYFFTPHRLENSGFLCVCNRLFNMHTQDEDHVHFRS